MGEHKTIKTIGICGPSGSGKTTLAKKLCADFNANLISLDNYFLLDPPLKKYETKGQNWELPENLDWAACRQDVSSLKQGKNTLVRKIDWETETYSEALVKPKEFLIAEGFLLLHDEELVALLDVSIYLDVPDEVGLRRRLQRVKTAEDRKWFEEVTFPEYAKRRKVFEERASIVLDGRDSPDKIYKMARAKILALKRTK